MHSNLVLLHFSEGCGHCKTMKPEYVDAAQTMKDEDVSWNRIFYLAGHG
jgi:thiol-disulfide isomerase/thioredoxin